MDKILDPLGYKKTRVVSYDDAYIEFIRGPCRKIVLVVEDTSFRVWVDLEAWALAICMRHTSRAGYSGSLSRTHRSDSRRMLHHISRGSGIQEYEVLYNRFEKALRTSQVFCLQRLPLRALCAAMETVEVKHGSVDIILKPNPLVFEPVKILK